MKIEALREPEGAWYKIKKRACSMGKGIQGGLEQWKVTPRNCGKLQRSLHISGAVIGLITLTQIN